MKLFAASCFLATTCLMNSNLAWAQEEEPIAVAKPAESSASDASKSEPPKSDATQTDSEKNAKPEGAATKVRPLTISVQLLRSDLVITGALTDSTLLALKTAFGEASIPLSEVAGVRFPSGQDTSTTLVMLNGDSITGASDVKTITVETEWGSARINGENISSMMFVPGLEWQSISGLNGARWTLTETKAQPTRPSTNTPGAPASGNFSGSAGSIPGLPAPVNNSTPRVVFPR